MKILKLAFLLKSKKLVKKVEKLKIISENSQFSTVLSKYFVEDTNTFRTYFEYSRFIYLQIINKNYFVESHIFINLGIKILFNMKL